MESSQITCNDFVIMLTSTLRDRKPVGVSEHWRDVTWLTLKRSILNAGQRRTEVEQRWKQEMSWEAMQ